MVAVLKSELLCRSSSSALLELLFLMEKVSHTKEEILVLFSEIHDEI